MANILISGRKVYFPKGSLTPISGRSGECACCNKAVTAKNSVRRAPYQFGGEEKKVRVDERTQEQVVYYIPTNYWTGVLICDLCSFDLADWECQRLDTDYDLWAPQWKRTGDGGECGETHIQPKSFDEQMKRLETYNSFDIRPYGRK